LDPYTAFQYTRDRWYCFASVESGRLLRSG
jgi:hypothetical protein